MLIRSNNRQYNQLRKLEFQRDYTKHAEGSVLVTMGETKVLCTASIDQKMPSFLRGKGQGWITAEYGMLPRSTHTRSSREARDGKQSGRTQEIQRLIGRSLRSAINLHELGERQIILDCDVIQADGGTRCAAINGAWISLYLSLQRLVARGDLIKLPEIKQVAAISVGIFDSQEILDLDYQEDSNAEIDMNVVMQHKNKLIEIQGTAEENSFSRGQLNSLLDLAEIGLEQIWQAQLQCLQL